MRERTNGIVKQMKLDETFFTDCGFSWRQDDEKIMKLNFCVGQ